MSSVKKDKPIYQILDDGTFVIENYYSGEPFASFLPGIAGLKGIPMWAFYVNRGQGISSFGVQDKNNSIMEFYSANNAYSFTQSLGFRTFIKVKKGGSSLFYEPFQSNPSQKSFVTQKMFINPYELMFEDVNSKIGLKTRVRYFTLPNESIAALMRIVEFENTGKKPLNLEIVDGMPKIITYGLEMQGLKHESWLVQAWTSVLNFDKTGIPLYKTKVAVQDTAEVVVLNKGNFYFSLLEKKNGFDKAQIIIDPDLVFGKNTNYSFPDEFITKNKLSLGSLQCADNKYASAMSYFSIGLKPRSKQSFYSVTGHITGESELNNYFKKVTKDKDYFKRKMQENKKVVENVTNAIYTESGIKKFDQYCGQTFLDNVLRGGMPIVLDARSKKHVYYVYSRKHGDLERDYNFFQLSPSYYSQGNGNFRDVNQNKRSDVMFNPKIEDYNVVSFYNYIQLDGFNPLLIKGILFDLNPDTSEANALFSKYVEEKSIPQLKAFFRKPFEPGSLLLLLERGSIALKISPDDFLSHCLEISQGMDMADPGHGYWVDHWTYNLDLLENYLAVYPDKARDILLNKKEFTYYDSPVVIVPREGRYVEAEPKKVRQFGSIIVDRDKENLIKQRKSQPLVVRERDNQDKIYKTNLLGKMLCLILNKLSSLDCEGMGVEMEGDKPGWYDALNGLPGIFGSSMPETFELKRTIKFLLKELKNLNLASNCKIYIAEEIFGFCRNLGDLLNNKQISAFDFWDRASDLKEQYRKEINLGVSGKEEVIIYTDLKDFLNKALEKIEAGIAKAFDKKTGLYYTYFSYDAVEYSCSGKVSHQGLPCVKVAKFRQRPLQLFLEGEVRYMKTEEDKEKVRGIHNTIKKSALYDKKINMYKLNASLKDEPDDIGRCTVFTPGWLENESIWVHMEYKYLLELVKAGLYKEFYEEFKKSGICFADPDIYGRSIFENSSFIVSSAFYDKRMWGRGCVARLSGATAEFVEIWLLMTMGKNPFRLDNNGRLILEFNPALSKEFFTKKNTFAFNFLNSTLVTYHNSKNIDTYSDKFNIDKIDISWNDGGTDTVNGKIIPENLALKIRNQEAKKIDVYF